jgi:hypothetical protein
MDERANVNMMRDGMRLLVTGIEIINNPAQPRDQTEHRPN